MDQRKSVYVWVCAYEKKGERKSLQLLKLTDDRFLRLRVRVEWNIVDYKFSQGT